MYLIIYTHLTTLLKPKLTLRQKNKQQFIIYIFIYTFYFRTKIKERHPYKLNHSKNYYKTLLLTLKKLYNQTHNSNQNTLIVSTIKIDYIILFEYQIYFAQFSMMMNYIRNA